MTVPRALYVCPSTGAATIAAAPEITASLDFQTVRVLLLRGVADAARPTPFERTEAIRPAKGIARFFAGRGIPVAELDVPPDSDIGCRERVASWLANSVPGDIDVIVFNAQAGTKQMSFGAWEALTEGNQGGNRVPVRRCFVSPGPPATVELEGMSSPVRDLSIAEYLLLYGFEEIGVPGREQKERFATNKRASLDKLWQAKKGRHNRQAQQIASELGASNQRPASWNADFLSKGGWLEARLYLAGTDAGRRHSQIQGFTYFKDWASGDANAVQFEVDLVVMNRGTLHLMECKAGPITQEDIHKQSALRDLLQGRAGINALISGDPPAIDGGLAAKAALKNIRIVEATDQNIAALLHDAFRG